MTSPRPRSPILASTLVAVVGTVTVGSVTIAPTANAQNAGKTSPYYELENTGAVFLGVEFGVSLGAFLGIQFGFADPSECNWCVPPGFDVSVRNALVWGDDRATAARIADGLMAGTGAGALAALIVPALTDTGAKDIWALEDSVIILDSMLVTLAITEALKVGIARERPAFYFGEGERTSSGEGPNKSFPSGHTSFAFAAATSAATLSFLRDYDSAPYIAAAGGTLAVSTGLFRIFADKHWATDVITGAVLGGAIGFSMPFFLHGREEAARNTTGGGQNLTLSVMPLELGGPRVFSLGGTW